MAATDAKAIPIKNQAYRVTFPILDADGDLVTAAAGLDSEVSKDGGTFADATSEATEIATSSGMYFLDLTATEMNADTVAIIVKTTTSGAKTTPIVLYTAARSINDLAYPTTSGRSMDVDAAGGVEVGSFQAGAITAAAFTAGAIDAAAIAADAIGASELADGAITALTFAAGAIDATAIANGAIDAATFAAGAIDAAAIANGAIDAATFAAGAIDAAAIAANAITSAKIATDAIGSAQLAQSAADKIIQAVSGTADSGTTTTIVDAERTEADTDYWKDSVVLITSGANVGQVRRISAFNATTDTITVDTAFTNAIVAGVTYIILRTAMQLAAGAGATDWTSAEKNQIRDALGVDGAKTAAVGGQLQVIDDYIDTEVAAIKAKTDQLTFTAANKVDASLQAAADVVAAVANKLADHVLRRTYANARTSSDGDALAFRSLLGAIGKLVNKWSISGATLTVYQEDDLTSTAPGGTQAITATAGADPITALDTT